MGPHTRKSTTVNTGEELKIERRSRAADLGDEGLRRKQVAVDLSKRRIAVYNRGESVELWFAATWSAWREDKAAALRAFFYQGTVWRKQCEHLESSLQEI